MLLVWVVLYAGDAWAEEYEENAAAHANNLLAHMRAFNLQNYYIGELTGSGDSANQV